MNFANWNLMFMFFTTSSDKLCKQKLHVYNNQHLLMNFASCNFMCRPMSLQPSDKFCKLKLYGVYSIIWWILQIKILQLVWHAPTGAMSLNFLSMEKGMMKLEPWLEFKASLLHSTGMTWKQSIPGFSNSRWVRLLYELDDKFWKIVFGRSTFHSIL